GDPANIVFDVSEEHIFVAGVGQAEQSLLTIEVRDDSGTPINEATYDDDSLDNLRVSLVSKPHGGEYVAGENAAGDIVDTRTGPIEVRTENGRIGLNLQAGTLPGTVEVLIEALYDKDGVALLQPVTAKLPQVSIASGPPHTIVLTSALLESVENMAGQGVYRRQGTAIVTDRYGNNVPDGTSINLGLIDSMIAQGATTNITGANITAGAAAFDATVVRNEVERGIQLDDRVVLQGVPAQDKSRHVASAGGDSLTVQNFYSADYAAKNYFVGASLLGGYISGTLTRGDVATLTPGTSITTDGLADVYVTYPANVNTINLGCGSVPAFDNRHLPVASAKVFTLASSSDNSATTLNEGRFCYAPIAGFTLSIIPDVKASGSTSRGIKLVDGGDEIPVPFEPLGAFVAVETLGSADICADAVNTTAVGCAAADTPLDPHAWLAGYKVCRIEAMSDQTACTDAGNTWFTGLKSDFDVDVFFNTITSTAVGAFDIDGDGSNDIAWQGAADTDGDGVPDDLNGDGVSDINDSAAIPVDFDGDTNVDFYSYPYTFGSGSASVQVIVTGDLIVSGDKATVTIVGGDGEAELSVEMP
ncbi:MAG TPA: hypothetical protein VGA63_12935, partial [Geopsychrobacteraceae bacterium]